MTFNGDLISSADRRRDNVPTSDAEGAGVTA
jgi:hypothetical protein